MRKSSLLYIITFFPFFALYRAAWLLDLIEYKLGGHSPDEH